MGKRSSFTRQPRDYYPTPEKAVIPLLPFLRQGTTFLEPCAGDGRLSAHLQKHGLVLTRQSDIAPRGLIADGYSSAGIRTVDALAIDERFCKGADLIITNPPWKREWLHAMIRHFSDLRPTWLLFDASWPHTTQSNELMRRCVAQVSVGRVKWFPNSLGNGKDDCSWYLFDKRHKGPPSNFYGRLTAPDATCKVGMSEDTR